MYPRWLDFIPSDESVLGEIAELNIVGVDSNGAIYGPGASIWYRDGNLDDPDRKPFILVTGEVYRPDHSLGSIYIITDLVRYAPLMFSVPLYWLSRPTLCLDDGDPPVKLTDKDLLRIRRECEIYLTPAITP